MASRTLQFDLGLAVAGTLVMGATWYFSRKRGEPHRVTPEAEVTVEWGGGSAKYLKLCIDVSPGAAASDIRSCTASPSSFTLNVYGAGIPFAAKLFLPLGVGKYLGVTIGSVPGNENNATEARGARIQLDVARSIAKPTHAARILDELKKLEKANDVIIFEVLRETADINAKEMVRVAARPSAMREALQAQLDRMVRTGARVTLRGADHEAAIAMAMAYRPADRTALGAATRFCVCPVLGLSVGWLLLSSLRGLVLDYVPRISVPGIDWGAARRASGLWLPALPRNAVEAFDIGALVERLSVGPHLEAEVLAAAAVILGRATVTKADLLAVRAELVKEAANLGVLQRIRGAFSFANLLWGASIVGIFCTTMPVLKIAGNFLRPYIRGLIDLLSKVASKVKVALVWVAENVIVPTLARCHKYGIFEALAHLVVVTIHVHALEAGGEGALNAGAILAVTGVIAFGAALAYSVKVHGKSAVEAAISFIPKRAVESVMSLLPALYIVPLAVLHHSTLLAYGATAAVLGALGFGVWVYPFCYSIGWRSEDTMATTAVACGLAIFGFCVGRAFCAVPIPLLELFAGPVFVLGGVGHYLALLIGSSRHYRGPDNNGKSSKITPYIRNNSVMMASLCAASSYGLMRGLPGLANTAITFGVLWMIEKFEDVKFFRAPIQVAIFGGSVATYYAAMWLHAHPDFVVKMVTAPLG